MKIHEVVRNAEPHTSISRDNFLCIQNSLNKNEKKNAFRKENNKNNITMKTKHLKDHVVLKLEECREKNI